MKITRIQALLVAGDAFAMVPETRKNDGKPFDGKFWVSFRGREAESKLGTPQTIAARENLS